MRARLLTIAPDRYDISIYGAEPHPNYNRILLSPVLAGEMTLPEIMLNDLDWYEANGVTLHAGRDKEVVEIQRGRREVRAADGTISPRQSLFKGTARQVARDAAETFQDAKDAVKGIIKR